MSQDLHPSQDRTDRFLLDTYIRRMGFRIFSRANDCEAMWIKDSVIYYQSDIVKTINKEDLAKIRRREAYYHKTRIKW
jgi:hypothetical protein